MAHAKIISVSSKRIVMVGTSLDGRGGMSSIANVYRSAGLFRNWRIVYIASYVDGGYLRKSLVAAKAIAEFASLLVRGRVLLMHVHSASNASFWRKSIFILLGTITRRPVVLHIHGGGFGEFYEQRLGPFGKWMVRTILNRVNRIIVVSRGLRELFESVTTGVLISVVPNPVQLDSATQQRESCRRNNVVLFLGRICREKGIDELLQAVALIVREIPQTILRVAGDGEIPAARERANALGISRNVEFLGWVKDEKKTTALADSTVFVLPSFVEALPMAILEAMAAGLPVVATDVGGVSEIIRGDTDGILVKPGDVPALAQAIKRVLTQPDLRTRMSATGKRIVEERYSVARIIPMIETIYRELGARPQEA